MDSHNDAFTFVDVSKAYVGRGKLPTRIESKQTLNVLVHTFALVVVNGFYEKVALCFYLTWVGVHFCRFAWGWVCPCLIYWALPLCVLGRFRYACRVVAEE